MLSSACPQLRRHDWSARPMWRLRTLMPWWRCFRLCFSSVESEIGVPSEFHALSQRPSGSRIPRCFASSQAFLQFECPPSKSMSGMVKYLVIFLIFRSWELISDSQPCDVASNAIRGNGHSGSPDNGREHGRIS